ncbi:unnamed protein product [Penicillium roqueforti FM164]|uniref:Genomic scaffold, ProqFM164S01 n=1 Tax=Penicillium roqueforti (strain FM164) TaxID=1365484 RepID=W6Q3U2_PENRF|nr:unnamed protein product [Penicillium roqueforti FM164]
MEWPLKVHRAPLLGGPQGPNRRDNDQSESVYMTLVRDAHISVSGRKGTFATDDVKSETLFLYISLSATIY